MTKNVSMASSSKYRNYYIINEDVLKSGLKGNELLVYALVRSYVTAGIPFDLTVAKIMERTNIDRRPTVIEVLQRLVAKGMLVKVGQEKVGVTSCVYELGGTENVPQRGTESVPVRKKNGCGKRTCRGTEKVPEGYGKRTCGGTESVPPYNNVDNTVGTTFNNTDNNIVCVSSARGEENFEEKKVGGEVFFPAGSVQAKEKLEMDVKVGIMEGWQRHYKDVYGAEYLLTRGSIMQEVSDLAPAIERKMEIDGKEVTQESVCEYCYELFTRMLTTANEWQQNNWNLRVITKQFNELIKQIKHGNPDTANKSERPRQIADASQFVDRI